MLESNLRLNDNFTFPAFLGYNPTSYNIFEQKISKEWGVCGVGVNIATKEWLLHCWAEAKRPPEDFPKFMGKAEKVIGVNAGGKMSAFNLIYELRDVIEKHGLKP